MSSPTSPSGSQRKRSRTFKARRALIACQRCRRLKKSCQPTDRERCERCRQSEQVCVYLPVPEDPLAPRPPGSSSAVLVPDSPTISPTEPLSPSFDLYLPDPPDGFDSAPHVTRNHVPFHPTPMHNPNPQSAGLSTASASIFAQFPPLYPPDVFSQRQLETTYPYLNNDGLYDDGSQALSAQTPLPFTTNSQHSDEDMVDPPHPHRYLPSTPNPSLQPHNHLNNFTIVTSAPLSLFNLHDASSFLPEFSPVASTSNPNHHLHSNMSMPGQSPTSYFEDSDFSLSSKLPYVTNPNYPSVIVDIGGLSRFFLFWYLQLLFLLSRFRGLYTPLPGVQLPLRIFHRR
ncbi:hypothetical protein PILCRDRAFT_823514 [Piloderma croceum F 1598]|uniref:Zn(2)-C6 fungal-type domain-containing protein n=1 Tax=Piloderma croceum (strain F 1598) TaxID=765440 RepID=A0A0C3FHJ8_PILCF|nr:hypothetical protein PILCRDRAFT_823514 [Piloderma croceum F 1598]